jgi:hypothetical protein
MKISLRPKIEPGLILMSGVALPTTRQMREIQNWKVKCDSNNGRSYGPSPIRIQHQATISSQWDQHEQLEDQASCKTSLTQIEFKWFPSIACRYLVDVTFCKTGSLLLCWRMLCRLTLTLWLGVIHCHLAPTSSHSLENSTKLVVAISTKISFSV